MAVKKNVSTKPQYDNGHEYKVMGISIGPNLLAVLRRLAGRNDLSLSAMARLLILEALENRQKMEDKGMKRNGVSVKLPSSSR